MDKIISISIITLLLTLIFKNINIEYVPFFHIMSLILTILCLLPFIKNIYSYLIMLESSIKKFDEIIKSILKILFISVMCEFSSQICSSSGDTFLSSKILFSGKIIIISIICPYIIKFYESIINLINEI